MTSKIRFAVRLPSLPLVLVSLIVSSATCAHAKDLNVLFLGDNGHHRPRERFVQLQPVLAARGVKMVYTDKVSDLNPDNLKGYDAVALYANIGSIDPKSEKALLDYVAAGGGFVPEQHSGANAMATRLAAAGK